MKSALLGPRVVVVVVVVATVVVVVVAATVVVVVVAASVVVVVVAASVVVVVVAASVVVVVVGAAVVVVVVSLDPTFSTCTAATLRQPMEFRVVTAGSAAVSTDAFIFAHAKPAPEFRVAPSSA
jgi:hypothetical protein